MACCLRAELAQGNAGEVADRCLRHGLVLNAVTATALRLEPPLIISEEEIDEGVGVLDRVLAEAT